VHLMSNENNENKELTAKQIELFSLVEKAISGDAAAFEELYVLKAREILFHTQSFLNNKADVEDVAQEVVIKMYENIHKLRSPYAYNSWQYRIIKFVCYSHNRKNRNAARTGGDEEYEDVAETNRDYAPESVATQSELNDVIYRAITGLPEKQRDSLFMFYYEELSYAEIAEAMGITLSTVSTNIMKGKKKLMETLKKDNHIANDGELLLGGAAVFPMFSEAFRAGVEGAFPDKMVEAFTEKCSRNLAGIDPSSVASAAKGVSHNLAVIVGVVIAVCVAAVVALAVFLPSAEPPVSEPAVSDVVKVPYEPAAEVLGSDGLRAAYVNPESLTLALGGEIGNVSDVGAGGDADTDADVGADSGAGGLVLSCDVYDIGGAKVYGYSREDAAIPHEFGVATIPSEVLAEFSAGEYEVVWSVASEDGRTAKVKWSFVIE
jgi:RNA polymerase sigma-70 factor (ECF subfamily)